MATACFLLVTFLPLPPLFSLPSLYSSMVSFTVSCAFFPYLAMSASIFVLRFVPAVSEDGADRLNEVGPHEGLVENCPHVGKDGGARQVLVVAAEENDRDFRLDRRRT